VWQLKCRYWGWFFFFFQVNGIHDNEDNPPDVPFFTGKARGTVKHTQPSSNEFTGNSTDVEKKVGILIYILQMDFLCLHVFSFN